MRKFWWSLTVLAGLIVSVVGASGFNLADTYRQRVNEQWQWFGYRELFNPARGDLEDGESTTWTVTLQAGREYKLIGACDVDCGDLDLELFDEYGYSVDEDYAGDDYPVVVVRPPYTQRYSFEVSMADCWYEPCGYMIGILGR
jgi:hypothetical protein